MKPDSGRVQGAIRTSLLAQGPTVFTAMHLLLVLLPVSMLFRRLCCHRFVCAISAGLPVCPFFPCPFIAYNPRRSSFIVHRSLLIVHCSSLIVNRSSLIVHRSSLSFYLLSFIVHRSSFIVHCFSIIVHRSSFIVHHYILSYLLSFIVNRSSFVLFSRGCNRVFFALLNKYRACARNSNNKKQK